MTPELMRQFLEELKDGTIPRTNATEAAAKAFATALAEPTEKRGRGRPKKSEGFGALFKQTLNSKGVAKNQKHTVEDVFRFVGDLLVSGAKDGAALRTAGKEFGKTADGIEKLLKPLGGLSEARKWAEIRRKWRETPLVKTALKISEMSRQLVPVIPKLSPKTIQRLQTLSEEEEK